MSGGAHFALDGGEGSAAPLLSAGLGLGSGFFVRLVGDGPSTATTVTAPEGRRA
ncbi:MAG: hypothetical protein R3F14_18835 [Polyangiaceae bacterium]